MREKLPMTAATAMIGTASFGPNCQTSTGTSMIDEPVPMMPLMAPASRPTAQTKTNCSVSIPQLEALDLPRRGFRQAVDEFDPARILPHADLLLHVLLQRLAQARGIAGAAFFQRDV